MGRPELGTKCTCTGCHERFYDLNRSPAICPKCGVQQPPEKPRMARPLRATFGGSRAQSRTPPAAVIADDDAEPVSAPEDDAEDDAEDDVLDTADEVDDETANDPDVVKPVE